MTKIIRILITMIEIFVPIVIIITGIISLTKTIFDNDNNSVKNAVLIIFRKFIVGSFIVFIPTIGFAVLDTLNYTSRYINLTDCIENSKDIEHFKELSRQREAEEQRQKDAKNESALQAYANTIKMASTSMIGAYKKDTTNDGSFIGDTYPDMTNDDMRYLVSVAMYEQGNKDGVRAELALMANRYELYGKKEGYISIADYVRRRGWFSTSNKPIHKDVNSYMSVGEEVFKLGNRGMPNYIDEHDCYDCNTSNLCINNGTKFKGDICMLKTGFTAINSLEEIRNHDNYKQGVTKIYTVFGKDNNGNYVEGDSYTFYFFPCSKCDPFGYTKRAYDIIKKS